MCQLVFVNAGDKMLNRAFLPPLLFSDSVGNQDGTGFMTNGPEGWDVYKTAIAADELPDLGLDIAERVVSNYPVIAHVRAASKGIEITDKNAHPFWGKRFVLAHNGRLYKKDENVAWNGTADDTGLGSDSEQFLLALENEAKDHPESPFPDLFAATMSKHKGKFALMIYDTWTDIYYIARGSSAELHIADILDVRPSGKTGDVIGFIVNTKKQSLLNALSIGNQMAQAVSGRRIGNSEIRELKKDTLYRVEGKKLVEVCEVKENAVTYSYSNNSKSTAITTTTSSVNKSIDIWSLGSRVLRFMNEHFLGVADIDALFYIFLGVGMADATRTDLRKFCENIIPKISAKKDVRAKLGKMLTTNGQIYAIAYSKVEGLVYPWMLSDQKAIEKLLEYEEQFYKGAG